MTDREMAVITYVAEQTSRKAVTEVLNKIKAEIEALPKTYPFYNHIDTYVKEDDVRKIIDKYKADLLIAGVERK